MKRTIFILIFFFPICHLFAQNSFQEIDAFVEKQMQMWHIPDISIAITNKDSILYRREFGTDSSKGNYFIGSISKPFTAIATMQLVEQGKINVDDPVKKYLPWFQTKNNTISDKITVLHFWAIHLSD